MISRRNLLLGGAGAVALTAGGIYWRFKGFLNPEPAPLGFTLKDGTLEKAKALLRQNPAVDIHAHPGRTFVHGASGLSWKMRIYSLLGSFEERAIAQMDEGGMAAVAFSGVADFSLLDARPGGLMAVREFEEGEAWEVFQTQMGNLNEFADEGLVTRILKSGDIEESHGAEKVGMLIAMEGGDFLEGKVERLKQGFDMGLRMLTLVHYKNNDVGDIMTASAANRGLTAFGEAVVGEMNRLGMVIDVAHASEPMAFEVLEKSTKPVCFSHSHVNTSKFRHPRFISQELAKLAASKGGVIGAWPVGFGALIMSTMIDRFEKLAEVVGVDGVALGTDMDANYKPVFDNYAKMPLMVGALLDRGWSDVDVAKVVGGNFIRVFKANMAA